MRQSELRGSRGCAQRISPLRPRAFSAGGLAKECQGKLVIKIQKKIVVDEHGAPTEAIIPWKQFCEIAEALGFDLDEPARADLRATRRDWRQGKSSAFVPLAKA